MNTHLKKLESTCIRLKNITGLSWAQKLELARISNSMRWLMTYKSSYSTIIIDDIINRLFVLQKEIGGQ